MFPLPARFHAFTAAAVVAAVFLPNLLSAQAPAPLTMEVAPALAAPTIGRDAAGIVTITGATPGMVIRHGKSWVTSCIPRPRAWANELEPVVNKLLGEMQK
jgi:hypothetical protein